MKHLLITGANGFIGSHLCPALQAHGYRITQAVRRLPDAPMQDMHYVETGNLATFDGWDAALQGIDTVIHLAGRAHQTSRAHAQDDAAFTEANVTATRRLIDACERNNISRLLFLSTIAVMGATSGDTPFTATNHNPQTPYARSKAEAEVVLRASGLDWTIIRIPLVYGPGVRANFLSLMHTVQRGLPLPLGCVRNRRSLLYTGNLVDTFAQILSCDASIRQTLLIADQETPSSPELIRALASAMERPARLLPVPLPLLKTGATLLGRPALYHKLCGNLVMDCTPSYDLLNWRPLVPQADGLRETAQWFTQTT